MKVLNQEDAYATQSDSIIVGFFSAGVPVYVCI